MLSLHWDIAAGVELWVATRLAKQTDIEKILGEQKLGGMVEGRDVGTERKGGG